MSDTPLRDAIRAQAKQEEASKKKRQRTEKFERLERRGQAMQKAGDQIASTGKSMFWFGVCLLFVIFISIPILEHLF